MNDLGLSNSPSARRFDATDEQLSSELKKWTGASPAPHPVGELLDRHWEAAFAYARLCTDGERAAGMLTTAAFTRLFGETLRQNGPTAAWRPHLLVTVRRIAAEWDADGRRDLLHPALRSEGEDGDRAAARLLPPVHRRTLSRAFQRLPQSARCLLWHTEVEAEPLAVPAGLLGLEDDGARVELARARERLREECLQVHRELATDDECHRYHRLLDVTCRRGGDVDPDLRGHLEQCRHCAHTADQLRQFEGLLGAALAEGILGWAAAAYVQVRVAGESAEPAAERPPSYAGEAFTEGGPAPARPGATAEAGANSRAGLRAGALSRIGSRAGSPSSTRSAPGTDSRPGSRRAAQKAARRAARRRNLTAAVLTVSGLVVLPLVVWAVIDSGTGAAPVANSGAAKSPAPGTDTATSDPSWIGAGEDAQGTLRGRLHNVASGLCIGIVGTKAVSGTETGLAACSSAAGQQWTYAPDGLLRSAANADLCLDSRLGYSVRLAPCAGASQPDPENVRYDFTLQGTLVPRSGQNLALAPAATDGSGALVLKNRVDSAAQRWVIDTSQPDPQMQFVNWGADSTLSDTPASAPTPRAAKSPTPTPTPSATPTATPPTSSSSGSNNTSCSYYYWYSCSPGGQSGSSGGSGYGYGGSGYGGGYGGYGSGSGFGGGR
ncbi:ricin-type beta-trefoil lectin domain protein [Streptomyces sp. NBC_01235]|uniref:ricin-type beta-trefoil lectin domain protein n=1 Tax=Streptomyces sp. NBC_01235 TaxID=2903788 RepID=UPI002E0ED2D3|nr:ricin-type beta-trefoil lectin domain protein [Streptomyces sp. NBC_01235]